ncbi:hypothetical protein [Vibrio diabolicus]|uniref:hypothetical protein n=1 Tax=Vibrio diabolicus TaxID=50719 RepID=UPI00211B382C|nr:hypothetical protein [Vibrio diabolicus]MCG6283763.1 hypothetical protein [Vibrio diabolicus]MCR9307223.1 hypothetical protein [Vibrio diabolicus]
MKYFLTFILIFFSFHTQSKLIQGELIVDGFVKNPTCSIILPPEEIDLGSYTPRDLIVGNTKVVNLHITVDCASSYSNGEFRGIYLNLMPLPFSPAIGSAVPGAMKTNLTGVGVQLSWDYNFGRLEFGENINSFHSSTGIFNIDISSKLIAIGSLLEENIGKGTAKAGMVISLSYF